MKIFVKTLKGTNFEIEAQPADTISDVKKAIETVHGALYPAAQQMLIHQGKVLKDETTLEDNNVVENSFIVIMLSKAKVSSGGASTASAPAPSSTQPAQTVATPQDSAPTVSVPELTNGSATTAAPAAAAPIQTDVYGQAASNLVAGTTLESTVQQILDMGGGSWDLDTVVRALRAAFNNPERAIEYLYSGIPAQAEILAVAQAPSTGEEAANPQAQSQQAAPVAATGGPNGNPLYLFPQMTSRESASFSTRYSNLPPRPTPEEVAALPEAPVVQEYNSVEDYYEEFIESPEYLQLAAEGPRAISRAFIQGLRPELRGLYQGRSFRNTSLTTVADTAMLVEIGHAITLARNFRGGRNRASIRRGAPGRYRDGRWVRIPRYERLRSPPRGPRQWRRRRRNDENDL